ncbi:MAG: HXXEE domain-containing protein [Planctomycetaceae bacterium]|nr:HXXEE domain-containing protein [Planctomycetaceae bacterium]
MSLSVSNQIRAWLVDDWQWPYATLFAAGGLLAIAPVWFHVAGLPLTLVYLQLPIYMLHQWEEHRSDRFRLYVNRMVGGGREALTPIATFWINSLGVWAVDLVALYLAVFVDVGFGLIAIYLPLLNALGHVGPGIAKRAYNPGLWTALLLFLPVGGWSAAVVSQASPGWEWHFIGVAVAVGVHAAILIHVARRLKRLRASGI